ncbi:MAG TPA: SRPBCC family protein [Kofleriaceae bacterium]|jgi:uncharacterized protein YndB with AHSA1/START domain
MPDLYAHRPHRPAPSTFVPKSAHVWRAFSSRPERVFDAFLDPDLIRSWFGPGLGEIVHIDVHAHVGGMFSISQRRGEMVIDTHGTYHTLDRPHRLAFSWATPAVRLPEGHVTVEIEPHDDGGSAVTLTHRIDPSWSGRIGEIESGWSHMLSAMSEALGYPASDDPSLDEPGSEQPPRRAPP